MSATRPAEGATAVAPEQLEQVVTATRLVGALIGESLANVRPAITAPQWRVLVLASEGDCNVSAVAEDLGVHMSNATRTCDRLVAAGLLERRRAEHDRRHVLLALTAAGRQLFDEAMAHRRTRIEEAMERMSVQERTDLARSFTRLVEAAREVRMTARTQGLAAPGRPADSA
jgi:DNA-binding MarR family transcriptional regulator